MKKRNSLFLPGDLLCKLLGKAMVLPDCLFNSCWARNPRVIRVIRVTLLGAHVVCVSTSQPLLPFQEGHLVLVLVARNWKDSLKTNQRPPENREDEEWRDI